MKWDEREEAASKGGKGGWLIFGASSVVFAPCPPPLTPVPDSRPDHCRSRPRPNPIKKKKTARGCGLCFLCAVRCFVRRACVKACPRRPPAPLSWGSRRRPVLFYFGVFGGRGEHGGVTKRISHTLENPISFLYKTKKLSPHTLPSPQRGSRLLQRQEQRHIERAQPREVGGEALVECGHAALARGLQRAVKDAGVA